MRVFVADDDRQLSTLLCQDLQREGSHELKAFSQTSLIPDAVMCAGATSLPKPIDPDTFIDVIEAFGPPFRKR